MKQKKAVCSCGIKTEIPFMKDIKFDKNVLKESFSDIKNYVNIKILECYKTVFKKENILKNFGFYILGILFTSNIICLF